MVAIFLPLNDENGLKNEGLRDILWDVVFGINSPRQFKRIDSHERFFRSKHRPSRKKKTIIAVSVLMKILAFIIAERMALQNHNF
jgi:hypothetical protein